MDDLAAAVRLAVAALREMSDEAGIARDRADTMATDLALHMMRLARRSHSTGTSDPAPPHRKRGKVRYRVRRSPDSQ